MTECQLGVTRLLRCGWNYLQLSNHWDCGKQKPRFLLRLLRPDQPYEVLRVCSASLAIRFLRSCSAILCQMWNIAALAFTTKKSLTQACWRLLTAEGPGEVVKDVGWEHTAQNAPLPLSGIHFCPLLLSDLWWISHIGPMALYLRAYQPFSLEPWYQPSWRSVQVVVAWAFSLGSFQIIFPKGKSALPKTIFGASCRLIFFQLHYDDFNQILIFVNEELLPVTLSSIHNLDLEMYTEMAGGKRKKKLRMFFSRKKCAL